MAALENRQRGRGARPRWVDNQSTESSFHTHKFKADAGGGRGWVRLVERGGRREGGEERGRRGGKRTLI